MERINHKVGKRKLFSVPCFPHPFCIPSEAYYLFSCVEIHKENMYFPIWCRRCNRVSFLFCFIRQPAESISLFAIPDEADDLAGNQITQNKWPPVPVQTFGSLWFLFEVRVCDVWLVSPNECNLVEARGHTQGSGTNMGSYSACPLYGLSFVWTGLICWKGVGAAAQHISLQSCEGDTFCGLSFFQRRPTLKWVTAADTMEACWKRC